MKKVITIATAIIISFLLHAPSVCVAETKDTWIREEYQVYIEEISNQYGVCPELIMAIVEHESSGRADATNKGCKGLMQINAKYHQDRMERLGVTDIYDPYSNILIGTDYIMELAEKHEELPLVLMVYNGTKNAIERWENEDYTGYAIRIMRRAEELERVHGK